MKSRVVFRIIVVVVCIYMSCLAQGQIKLRANTAASYWQHTGLFGLAIGLGLEVPIGQQFGVAVDYSFGYGTINRYGQMDNVDRDGWITVFANEEPWAQWIGPHPSTSLGAKTDFAKQHQMTLMLTRTITAKGERDITFGLGAYAAVVEHFFTFTNVLVDVDLDAVYRGQLNYVPVSHRRLFFYGLHGEVGVDVKVAGRKITPYIAGAYGPRYGSYGSVGLRLTTELRRKE